MAKVISWAAVATFFLIGLQAIFLTGTAEHLTSRGLVVVGLLLQAWSSRFPDQSPSRTMKTAYDGRVGDVIAIATMAAGIAMVFAVFVASDDASYRKPILLCGLAISICGLIAQELLLRVRL